VCDNEKRYPDIPEQVRPNFDATVQYVNGKWTQVNDNRERHLDNEPGIVSCAKRPGQNDAELSEQAVNYMDYARDPESRMFTQSQIDVMREYLEHEGGRDYVEPEAMLLSPPLNQITEDNEETSSSTKLSTGAIVGIVVGVVVFVILLILFAWYMYRRPKPSVSNANQTSRAATSDDDILLP
jgi:hypothetical protein